MQESNISFRFLIPTDQNAPKTIQPTMSSLHYPTSGTFSSFFFDLLPFFATRADMCCKAKFFQQVSHFRIIVAFIQTHILLLLSGRFRSFYHNVFKGVAYHLHILAVGTLDRQSNRNTMSFRQHTPFYATFCPIRWVGSAFFFRPMALSPWHHPC
jgi:hypothetical protein